MKRPPALKKGDFVYLLSTARKIDKKELDFAIQTFERWGYQALLGSTIDAEENQFAGNDDCRAKDFQQALNDPKVKAIICVRGGYGSVRIIDSIDFNSFEKNPKWVVGYSDITVIHSHILRHTNTCTLHASMPINFSKNTEKSLLSLKLALEGRNVDYQINTHKLNRAGKTTGTVCGGNLSVLYSIMNTDSAMDFTNKILFIEDLDEYLYHIDRMMMQFKRSGILSKIKGLIVGGMTDMKDNVVPFGKTAEEVILDAVLEYDYPVLFNFPAGHIDDNQAIVLGREVQIDIDENQVKLGYV
jgi:muramoyltetrapeptide carboxypeptidase